MSSYAEARWQFLVCEGPTCGGCKFSPVLTTALREEVDAQALQARISVLPYLCLGRCRDGVNLLVRKLKPSEELHALPCMTALEEKDVWLYSQVDPTLAPALVQSHAREDRALKPLAQVY